MRLTEDQIQSFRALILDYYHDQGRYDLPWRQSEVDGSYSPYKILVSEIMLQQTQVNRVIPKYRLFLELFPTIEALARASLADVLIAWSGLGYNRRAKFLHQAAKMVDTELAGDFPSGSAELQKLPGVGKNTAGAILAYAFNRPQPFIETNIRTVYFQAFFADKEAITDNEVLDLVQQTIDTTSPRDWYWALMDYGSHLKASGIRLNMLSKSYVKQSAFQGSMRQIRGEVIRLLAQSPQTYDQLRRVITDDRLLGVITTLIAEQLIKEKQKLYYLSD